ncbi:MAG: LysM peptidoglycan-binding domain-containing protein, partial [Gemmatimonadetes bacterium]|nr:LysM peptidoglycan-binding domain-containing protein [Gemmatimonadota bacterium]
WYLQPLAVGKEISLPISSAAAPDRRAVTSLPTPLSSAPGRSAEEKKNEQDLRYTVRRGDSLERIARRYGTTVRALRTANRLRGTQINIGAVLRIPTGRTETTLYRVRWGDTLGEIALRHNTTIATLVRLNNLRSHHIQAGKVLRIPAS